MNTSLTEALVKIQEEADGDNISIEDIVEALNSRGFGALVIGPALLAVFPTGAIPGVPALSGVLIFLFSVQILLGRDYPWLPKRLKKISFSKDKYEKGMRKIKPYTEWIDNFFHPRFEILTKDAAHTFVALVCMVLATIMIAIGFVPFLPMALAMAVVMLGLGLSVHDGLLVAIGLVITIGSLSIIPWVAL